jgi:DNA-binding NarL/FixJ family response regulator
MELMLKRLVFMIKIMIIDNNDPDRNAVNAVLSSESDFNISLGKDSYDALKLVTSLKPNIAIIGTNLKNDIDGIETVSLLKFHAPAMAIMVLAGIEDENHIRKAVQYRVSAYLLKSTDMNRLAEYIRGVHAGECIITPRIAGKVFQMFADLVNQGINPSRESKKSLISCNLSRPELKVMACVAAGYSNSETAKILNLKEGTVRNCVSAIMKKTGLANRTQIALFALKHGAAANSGGLKKGAPRRGGKRARF